MLEAIDKLSARHVAIVVCCCLTCGIPIAMLMNTAGLYYPIIAEEFDVPTAQISAWMAIHMVSAAVFSPVVGNIATRFHMRTLMLGGVLLAATAFLVFSMATAPWMFWAIATITGFVMGACMFVVPASLINRWFAKHVGFLIGLYTAFTGIGAALFLLVGQMILDTAGWRAAYLSYAVISLVVCVPAVLLCIRDTPEECGLRPYGYSEIAQADDPAVSDELGDDADVRRYASMCMRTPSFWLLLLAGFFANVVCQAQAYFPKYIMWIDEQSVMGLAPAAFMAGAVVPSITHVGNGTGKLFLGAFSDFSVSKATTALCVSGAAGLLCVWLLPSTPLLGVGGLVDGFLLAAIPVIIPMLARASFGSGRAYPIIYAYVATAPFLGGATGNILLPMLADGPGGFDAMFAASVIMLPIVLVAALIALRLSPQSGHVEKRRPAR